MRHEQNESAIDDSFCDNYVVDEGRSLGVVLQEKAPNHLPLLQAKAVVVSYFKVKSNKGAAGNDEQTIEDFERDLKRNLYKVWNRMSSGSYFPPPVRTVR